MTISLWLGRLTKHLRTERRKQGRKPAAASGEVLESRRLLTTFTVNTPFDIVDATDGLLSLREALAAAKEDTTAESDEIVFADELAYKTVHADWIDAPDDRGFRNTSPNSGGQFVVDSNVTIDASDVGFVRIGHDRGEAFEHRIFKVEAGVTATFVSLFVQGGDADESFDSGQTQADSDGDGAGIWNGGNLTLTDVVVGGNFALSDNSFAAPRRGGGIYNDVGATLTIEDSHIGEMSLEDDFVVDQGLTADSFHEAENREVAIYTAQDRGGDIVAKSTDDLTVVSGNGANGDGGGIYNNGTLYLRNSVVRANRVKSQFEGLSEGEPIGFGAGIYNNGVMEITDTLIEAHDGFLSNNGQGALAGAGIYNAFAGQLVIRQSQLRDNKSPTEGAAIYNVGTLTVEDSAFAGNSATEQRFAAAGGAIFNDGNATITRSSFFENSAHGDGGAILNDTGATLVLDHVTLADNSSEQDGGGLYVRSGSTATINSSTIARNFALEAGGGIGSRGTTTLTSTVVAENELGPGDDFPGTDVRSIGTLNSNGFNLIETTDGYGFDNEPQVSDTLGIAAHLGLPGNYGGGVITIPLQPNSPALDSGATVVDGSTIDQRGEPRTIGSVADRGAFESQPPTSMRVDTLSDISDGFYDEGEFSLREAIEWANRLPGADEIAFDEDFLRELADAGESVNLVLEGAAFSITDELTIHGPGVDVLTITGSGQDRLFDVSAGTKFTLTNATLTGGHEFNGGAIYSEGDLTLRHVRATGNTADGRGGAVYSTGPLILNGVTLDNNIADFDNNSTTAAGGGAFSTGPTLVVNSTVSGNKADNGGGLFLSGDATHEVRSSTIVLNRANGVGGGIRARNVAVGNSLIALNSASTAEASDVSAITPTSLGFNVISVASPQFVDGQNSDIAGSSDQPLDPLIGDLRTLGNGIPVHGLLPGSPAIEAADPTNFPRFDQRGVARPVDVLPDSGAFEYVAPEFESNEVIVDSLSGIADGEFGAGQFSLAEAVLLVNADDDLDTIRFHDSLTAESSAVIEFDVHTRPGADTSDRSGFRFFEDVNIVGPGADRLTIDSIGSHSVFTFDNDQESQTTSWISGLSITGGSATNGGGIYSAERLSLTNVHIHNNTSNRGGGVYNDGHLTIENSTLASNFAVLNGAGLYNAADADLHNVTLSGNGDHRVEFGGAVFADSGSTTSLVHVTATENEANHGGAFFGQDSQLTVANSLVSGNQGNLSFPDINPSGVTITSLGGNIFGSNAGESFLQSSDQSGTESEPLIPFMTDLALPAQATVPMHGLLPTRAGNIAENTALASRSLPTDARGIGRPTDGGFEVGAFELADIDRTEFTWETELVVDRWDDTLDAVYEPGQLTLREAIILANAFDGTHQEVINGVSYDIIRFSDDLLAELAQLDEGERALKLRKGSLQIDANVILDPFYGETDRTKIDRGLVVVDGDAKSRVVEVKANLVAQLRNFTVTNGREIGSGNHGGGIQSRADLTLRNMAVIDNAAGPNSQANGGGIAAIDGSLQIHHSSFRDNESSWVGGGVWAAHAVPLKVSYSEFENNRAEFGGGIGSNDTMSGAEINTVITSSTLANNVATTGGGGGLYVVGNGRVSNSTISGNDSLSGAVRGGGGILFNGSVNEKLEVWNSTIAYNNGRNKGGAIRSHLGGPIEVANSIIAYNSTITAPNVGVTVTSLGNNLFQWPSNGWVDEQPTDIFFDANDPLTDPALGPLADNGGPTKTHLLMSHSAAIDAGNENYMPLMDQRGRALVDIPDDQLLNDGTTIPDIGAYEVQGVANSNWSYQAANQNQFGPGDATTFGFGFDDGRENSDVQRDPYFLGFEFDTGPLSYGGITEGLFGDRYGGRLDADFSGKFGFDVGFYVNSGSVDVTYDGAVDYILDVGDDYAGVTAFASVTDGNLQTVSPKVGAYLDLVLQVNADVSATGCLIGCVTADLLDIHFNESVELLSLNRQVTDSNDFPIFSDQNGVGVVRRKDGKFYYLRETNSGGYTPVPGNDAGPLVPLLSGDVSYFSISLEDLLEDETESKEEKARRSIEGKNAVRKREDANEEFQRSADEVSRLNRQLEQAEARQRNPTSGSDLLDARKEVIRLAGKDYADAIDSGDSLPAKAGEIHTAEETSFQAAKKLQDADDDLRRVKDKNKRTNDKKKSQKAEAGNGVVLSFQEAEGSLLGAQVDIGIGSSAGKFGSIQKNVGSAQVTLPDVNLNDASIDGLGRLSATTDNFEPNSEADDNRQVAKASVDLASMIPFGGSTSLSVGPLSLDYTTISYELEPQLNVTQDVAASYENVGMTYSFFQVDNPDTDFDESTLTVTTEVTVNGEVVGAASSVTFNQGDNVMIAATNYDDVPGNDPILVMPSMSVQSQFRNDIGLEFDLDGVFSAFSLALSAFDISIVDIGPLIQNRHDLSTADLGDVFNKTFTLPEQQIPLDGFTLFDKKTEGRTANAALTTTPTEANPDVAVRDVASVHTGPPVTFFASALEDAGNPDTYFQTLDVRVTGANHGVDKLEVLDDRLVVTDNGGGHFTIDGFTEDMVQERSLAVFALTFTEGADPEELVAATVTTTRSNPASRSAGIEGETEEITDDDFDQIGFQSVLSNDIDDNGVVDPETDGVLLIRRLAGFSGSALVDGAIGENARRTDPTQIAQYIDELRNAVFVNDEGATVESLDIDGDDGTASPLGDGILLARYMAGQRGEDLTGGLLPNDARRNDPDEIANYIQFGRSANPDANEDAVGEALVPVAEDPVIDESLLGSSPTNAFTDPTNAESGRQQFELATFGQTFSIVESYFGEDDTGELGSRVPVGAPNSFATENGKHLIESGGKIGNDDQPIFEQTVSGTLGTNEPIFIQGPDAAVVEYVATGGARFNSLTLNPRINGNVYLPTRYDLYLWNGSDWEFDRLVTDSDPDQLQADGNVTIAFDAPVDRFRLYSHVTNNRELHDARNEVVPEFTVATGFTLSSVSGTPNVERTVIAERVDLEATTPIRVERPAFATDSSPVLWDFHVERNADQLSVAPSSVDRTLIETTFAVASTESVSIIGHDNVEDTLTISESGQIISTPIRFDGGFRTDQVVIAGSGTIIDLVDRSQQTTTPTLEEVSATPLSLTDVEVIDLTGTGNNTLLLNADAVLNNDTFNQQLFVHRDEGDVVKIGSGWDQFPDEVVADVTYNVFTQGRATLYVQEAGGGVLMSGRAVGTSARQLETTTGDNPQAESSPASLVSATLPAVIAANQSNSPANIQVNARETYVASGADTIFDLTWDPANGTQPAETGLNIQLHYDSTQLNFAMLDDFFADQFSAVQDVAESEVGDDGDPLTDRVVNLLWLDVEKQWPSAALQSGDRLAAVNFTQTDAFEAATVNARATTTGGKRLTDRQTTVQIGEQPIITSPVRRTPVSSPQIAWQPVDLAVRYEVVLSDANGEVFRDNNVTSTSITSPELDLGVYQLTVRGVTAQGDLLPANEPETFTVKTRATIIQPSSGNTSDNPELTWNSIPGADRYFVWVNDAKGVVYQNDSVIGTSITPTDFGLGQHRMWVQGISNNGVRGEWSEVRTFTIANQPTLTTPIQSTFDTTPTFSWTAVEGADSYDLWVRDLTRQQDQIIRQQNVNGTSFTTTNELAFGRYRYWVKAQAENGTAGQWSAGETFYVGGRTTNLSPVNQTTARPLFSWDSVDGAGSYDVFVGRKGTASGSVLRATVTNTSHQFDQMLEPGEYRFWVKAISTDGTSGFWSQQSDFVVT